VSTKEVRNVARAVADIISKLTDALLQRTTACSDAQSWTSKRHDSAYHVLGNAGEGQPLLKVGNIGLPSRQIVADAIDRALATIGLHDTEAKRDPARETISDALPNLTGFRAGGRRDRPDRISSGLQNVPNVATGSSPGRHARQQHRRRCKKRHA
jgi:hypothetical protein